MDGGAVRSAPQSGDYEIYDDEALGRGGNGIVFLGHHPRLGRPVAFKRVDLDAPAASVERFVREAQLAGSLTHPSIVFVFDVFEHEGVPYIAMEYVERGALRAWMPVGPQQAFIAIEGMLGALAYAHRAGIVHRDVKPENLLVTDARRGEADRLRPRLGPGRDQRQGRRNARLPRAGGPRRRQHRAAVGPLLRRRGRLRTAHGPPDRRPRRRERLRAAHERADPAPAGGQPDARPGRRRLAGTDALPAPGGSPRERRGRVGRARADGRAAARRAVAPRGPERLGVRVRAPARRRRSPRRSRATRSSTRRRVRWQRDLALGALGLSPRPRWCVSCAPMRVGVQLPEVEREVRWPEYLAMAMAAEEVGFDSIWVGDHLLYDEPDRARGRCGRMMAALAAVTRARHDRAARRVRRLSPARADRQDGGDDRRDQRRALRARARRRAGTGASSTPSASRTTSACRASRRRSRSSAACWPASA